MNERLDLNKRNYPKNLVVRKERRRGVWKRGRGLIKLATYCFAIVLILIMVEFIIFCEKSNLPANWIRII